MPARGRIKGNKWICADKFEKNSGIGDKLLWKWVWMELKLEVYKRSVRCPDTPQISSTVTTPSPLAEGSNKAKEVQPARLWIREHKERVRICVRSSIKNWEINANLHCEECDLNLLSPQDMQSPSSQAGDKGIILWEICPRKKRLTGFDIWYTQ